MMNMFEEIFMIIIMSFSGFMVQDIEFVFVGVKYFEFVLWEVGGLGNKVEMDVVVEFRIDFNCLCMKVIDSKCLKLV